MELGKNETMAVIVSRDVSGLARNLSPRTGAMVANCDGWMSWELEM